MKDEPRNGQLSVSLAQRLHRTLTADKEQIFDCLQDPAPEVLRALLKNPALQTEHLLVLLLRRDLSEDLLKAIYRLDQTGTSRPLKLALVKNPVTPAPIVQSLLPHLRLFELVDLCFLPGVTADQRLTAERTILLRIESEPLGNRITLARRGTATVVGELLNKGEPQLMKACLNNPRLKEAAIAKLLRGPKATAETISIIARHPRWKKRPNLRQSILRHRLTPQIWFTLWLPILPLRELRHLLSSHQSPLVQQTLIRNELKQRQPK
ncbi:MAG: hypothetical protein K8R55_05795 [Desulfuromonadaceae bacterium]|nr:hypothetical protein [Desulfuromonadaceae bacterium]